MEEVCLSSEPVLDEDGGDEVKESCGLGVHSIVADDTGLKKYVLCPIVGMEFDSFDEAYDFYNLYAREQGFSIRVGNSWFRSVMRERYRAKLSCSSAGFKKNSKSNNPRPETRTGCRAMIIITLTDQEKWQIIKVELEHNHLVNPQAERSFMTHKKMVSTDTTHQQSFTEAHTIKLYRTAVIDTSCSRSLDFGDLEMRDAVDYTKHLRLKEGDMRAVYNYFCRMKLTSPNFFYLMDLDDQGRLKNVVWADFRSRVAYGQFSDTIFIDTACLTNKFAIPLISFIGVNNHGHYVLLGCAFIGYETEENFAWILRVWLTCMLGHPPQVIITDLDKPLQSAVSEVFPRARHCYSWSHIVRRVCDRLGGCKGFEAIRKKLNKAVYNSLKIAEFENAWRDMMGQYELGDDKWLQSLYKDRKKWAPVYLKDVFFSGMIPIHKNESLSTFFEGYVQKYSSFREFLEKYDLALQKKHMKEAMADLDTKNSDFQLKTRCSFELQLAKAYTKEIFSVNLRLKACTLAFTPGRHALNVLNYNGIEEVPSRYILPRWRKDFKCTYPSIGIPVHPYVNGPLHCYHHLYKSALQVVEVGAKSNEHYKAVLQELEELVRKLEIMDGM